jgi:tetrapyrrole methylase family protein/MazG family protein
MEYSFYELVKILKILRSEDGCPWDREQTNETIKYDTLEEAYELVEAINNKDDDNLVEELGDLLLHVVFHTQIGVDENRFSMDDVLKSIIDKMIRRHPHVFKDVIANNSEEVLEQWDEIKKIEKNHTTQSQVLRSVAKALPALTRATKVGKKAAKVGFDFENKNQLIDKLCEEVDETVEAIKIGDINHVEEEIGDLLFQIVNISRFFHINPENALTNATEKFINRFEGVEELASVDSLELGDLDPKKLDKYWKRVKFNEER